MASFEFPFVKGYPTRNPPSKYDPLRVKDRIQHIHYLVSCGVKPKNAKHLIDTLGVEPAHQLLNAASERKAISMVNEIGKEKLLQLLKTFEGNELTRLIKKIGIKDTIFLSNLPDLDRAKYIFSVFGPKQGKAIILQIGTLQGTDLIDLGPRNAKRLVSAVGPRIASQAILFNLLPVKKILRQSKTNDEIRAQIKQLIMDTRRKRNSNKVK